MENLPTIVTFSLAVGLCALTPQPHSAPHTVRAQTDAGATTGSPTTGDSVALGLESTFRATADKVYPSVVSIAAYSRTGTEAREDDTVKARWRLQLEQEYPGFEVVGSGSGVVLSEDGYILTNRHYLLRPDGRPADLVDVETHDNRHTLCRIVGMEPTLNMAILKLEVYAEGNPPKFTPIEFGDSHRLLPGHWAIAVADPFGPEKYFGVGHFAATPNRECYQEQLTATYLQASMRVHPGSYGGPLVDIHGRFVGMLTPFNAKPGSAGKAQHLSIEFALPSNIIQGLYRTILMNESRVSPWVGFAVMSLPELYKERGVQAMESLNRPRVGIYIENTFNPGPAHSVGIEPGDFLVKFDGHYIGSPLDFQKYLYMAGIGNEVEVEIFREGETFRCLILIEARPEMATTR